MFHIASQVLPDGDMKMQEENYSKSAISLMLLQPEDSLISLQNTLGLWRAHELRTRQTMSDQLLQLLLKESGVDMFVLRETCQIWQSP